MKCPEDCIAEQKSLEVECLKLIYVEQEEKYNTFYCHIKWGNGAYVKERIYSKKGKAIVEQNVPVFNK